MVRWLILKSRPISAPSWRPRSSIATARCVGVPRSPHRSCLKKPPSRPPVKVTFSMTRLLAGEVPPAVKGQSSRKIFEAENI